MRLTVLAITLWAALAAAALPVGEQILKTRDGRTLVGVVLSETQQGYLFKMADKTELVLFSNIDDLRPALEPPPVVPDVATPPPPPPYVPPEPAAELPTPPPPQVDPERQPGQPREPEEAPVVDWRSQRKGFHWSIGVGAMVDPGFFGSSGARPTVAFFVGAVPSVRWSFGWLDVSAEVMPLGYFKGAVKAFFLGANPQLRINFARFFSLGVGLYGALVISPSVDFCLGPSFSPAILRLGSEGEHEVRLWVASPVIATSNEISGTMLLLLSYSYVF